MCVCVCRRASKPVRWFWDTDKLPGEAAKCFERQRGCLELFGKCCKWFAICNEEVDEKRILQIQGPTSSRCQHLQLQVRYKYQRYAAIVWRCLEHWPQAKDWMGGIHANKAQSLLCQHCCLPGLYFTFITMQGDPFKAETRVKWRPFQIAMNINEQSSLNQNKAPVHRSLQPGDSTHSNYSTARPKYCFNLQVGMWQFAEKHVVPNTLKVWPLQVSFHWFPPNSLDLPWLHFQLLRHMEDLSRKPSIPRFQKEPKPTAKRFVAPAD